MNVVETCTGSATPLVSGSIAPSACAAIVRGLYASSRSVMPLSRMDHIRPPPPCKTVPRARYADGTDARTGDDERPLLLRGADRGRRGRAGARPRPRQHDARRLA